MLDALSHALQITAFVAVMMIAVEYLNILTRGTTPAALASGRWIQYALGVLLGALPGCLGSFAMVALYTHRVVSLGALTACMVATSGDEAFVMLALFPEKALILTAGLAILGAIAGMATDLAMKPGPGRAGGHDLVYHAAEPCVGYSRGEILRQLREPVPARGILGVALALLTVSLGLGWIGLPEQSWMWWTQLAASAFALFIVLTVPDHFLDEHLWRHVALQHVPRIFAWTLGALLAIALIRRFPALPWSGEGGRWGLLAAAALLGILPESGPHLLFVTLFGEGLAPMSVLVTSSIVQDGHGMLPLLAHSRRDFLKVKGIKLALGLAAGTIMMALGR